VPPHHEVMGAIGAALLSLEDNVARGGETKFNGFGISEATYHVSSFECKVCPSLCEIAQISLNSTKLACWGGRCDLWGSMLTG
jgi:hypothetical protein